jgi:hypothetical protein
MRKSTLLAAGAGLFLAAACADAALTWVGTGGDPAFEGNPFVRRAMERFGPWGLLLAKSIAAGLCLLAAAAWEEPIRRRAAWVERLPMLPWTRRWLLSGDRSWVAFVPLYGVALAQLAGALAWAVLLVAF